MIMKRPLISVIIPVLNEEKCLPVILESIKNQTYDNIETIVAISPENTDRSREIAESYGAKIAKGGLHAEARNNGAREASGEILFFFDADEIFDEDTISFAVRYILNNNSDFGMFKYKFEFSEENSMLRKMLGNFVNFQLSLMLNIVSFLFNPTGGHCTYIKSDLFKKINGYNEELVVAEDFDLGERASKYGEYRIIPYFVYQSDRRLETDGFFLFMFKLPLTYIAQVFGLNRFHNLLYKRRVDEGEYSSKFNK